MSSPTGRWQFWIDRGGTFTDVVARRPDGGLRDAQAALATTRSATRTPPSQGIREILGVRAGRAHPRRAHRRREDGHDRGDQRAARAQGRADGTGHHPRVRRRAAHRLPEPAGSFALHIRLPELLYARVIEVDGRYDAHGGELVPLRSGRSEGRSAGGVPGRASARSPSCSCTPMLTRTTSGAWRTWRGAIGFTQVSASHETIPLMKLVSRGRYHRGGRVSLALARAATWRRSRWARPSGAGHPADVHAVQRRAHRRRAPSAARTASSPDPPGGSSVQWRPPPWPDSDKVISFDMGGTSTDVAHYAGELERSYETEVGGRTAARADAAHPHGGRGRRLPPALRRQPLSASGPSPRAPIPGRPATAAAGRSP